MQTEPKMHTSQVHEENTTPYYMEQLKWMRSHNNKSRSNSDSSSKSLPTNQHFLSSNVNMDLEEKDSRDALDDEEYIVDDDVDEDDDDFDDDDGIVSDCDDDRDSLNDLDDQFSFFKQRMQHNREYLMSFDNSDHGHQFGNGSIFSRNHPNHLCSSENRLAPDETSGHSLSLDGAKTGGSSFTSENMETSTDEFASSDSKNIETSNKQDCIFNEKQERKEKLLNYMKKQSEKHGAQVLTCNGCREVILSERILKVEDTFWHTKCLKCKICGVPFTNTCFLQNKQLYCRKDYMEKFSPKCTSCGVIIPSAHEVVMRANKRVYHLECFRCYVCQKKLNTGDQFYLVNDKDLICKKDYEEQNTREVELDANSKRPRTSISAKQLETLKAAYSQSSKPARHVREKLSSETGLDLRVVQVWFQNRRAKEKRLNKETEQGKCGHYRASGGNFGSFDHDLNSGVVTGKRSGRSASNNNRKRSSGSSARLHHTKLTASLQQNGIMNPNFHIGNLGDNSFGISALNLNENGSCSAPLHFLPGPSGVATSYTQQMHDRLPHPHITLGNTAQSSFSGVLPNSTIISAAAIQPPSDPYSYSTSEDPPEVQPSIEDLSAPDMTGPKLEAEYSPPFADAGKENLSHPFPPALYNAAECIGNRFAGVFSQPKFTQHPFIDSNEAATPSEMPHNVRLW